MIGNAELRETKNIVSVMSTGYIYGTHWAGLLSLTGIGCFGERVTVEKIVSVKV